MSQWTQNTIQNTSADQVYITTIKEQLSAADAKARVDASSDKGTFYVSAKPEKGLAIVKDSEGIPTVTDNVQLGTFSTKSAAESFVNSINSGASAIDGFTGAKVDTMASGNSTLDQLTNEFGNSSMLENFLTSNDPVINVDMVLEEICEFILSDEEIGDWSTLRKKIWKKIRKLINKAINKAIESVITALQNYSKKLRKMVADKMRSFLAEYVADTCIVGLNDAIDEFLNPDDLLSVEELVGSIEDMLYEADMAVGELWDEIEDLVDKINTPIQAVLHPNDPKSKKFFAKACADAKEYLIESLCARTKAYQDRLADGLTKSIQDKIKDWLQGCFFQQLLKSANKIAPDAIPTDVLNRINNLAQQGELMDAYNIALASGLDLASLNVELPYQGDWITQVYGDPYLFAPQRPYNTAQMAKYLTDGLPSVTEMMSGNVSQDKLSHDYVVKNWSTSDSTVAVTQTALESRIAENKASISGSENSGNSISFETPDGITVEVSTVKSISRNDLADSVS